MALKLTPSGNDLLLRSTVGAVQINFKAIQLGNGANAGESAATLSNPLLTVDITSYETVERFVTLHAVFNNSTVPAGFRATEIGILADDPDNEGQTLLYAYEYTIDAKADYIPAGTDKMLETQMDVLVYIGDAENVTASISQSIVYASKAEFDEFVARRDNPNQVTAQQVGLDNVPNVATNDQTPTYAEATTLTTLTSGEKLSTAFGKIAKAVRSLIEHIGKVGKNIHQETPESIGAAEASHFHSTTDITTGILGMARGGLGNDVGRAASASKLATARTICVNLESETAESFDGSANVSPGVGGVLPVEHGGTAVQSYDALREKLGALTIAIGSYVGTGTYGADHPNSLTFDFVPKIVFISENSGASSAHVGTYMIHGAKYATTPWGSSTSVNILTWSGTTVEWYHGNTLTAQAQYNESGTEYFYAAIG